ncbi:Rab3 GTPase-activating protein catalytic subunit [Nowakowskiella sp. JEL0078]|nr:Rab3 GTPase-activating protein catalytic subunit [Nowakowskiella sp. JEL0078]
MDDEAIKTESAQNECFATDHLRTQSEPVAINSDKIDLSTSLSYSQSPVALVEEILQTENLVEEEDDFFEIVDHTTASHWERFISSLEQEIQAIESSNAEDPDSVKSVDIWLADVKYSLSLLKPSSRHPLLRWSELTQAFLLTLNDESSNPSQSATPVPGAFSSVQSNRFKIDNTSTKLLLSSCSIALMNTMCDVPIFVQCGPSWKSLFTGIRLEFDSHSIFCPAFETRYRSAFVPYLPDSDTKFLFVTDMFLKHAVDVAVIDLSDTEEPGWLFFKKHYASRLGAHNMIENRVVLKNSTLAISLSYKTANIDETWHNDACWNPHLLLDDKGPSSASSSEIVTPDVELVNIPFGPASNPIISFTLECSLPTLPLETYLALSEPDPDPINAPEWSIIVEYQKPEQNRGEYHKATNLLSQTLLGIIDAIDQTQRNNNTIPLPGNSIQSEPWSWVDKSDILFAIQTLFQPQSRDHTDKPTRNASLFYPPRTLPSLLSIFLLDAASPTSHLRTTVTPTTLLRALWPIIVREIRRLWETRSSIPNVDDSSDPIDMRRPLLFQKLQMLNRCISRLPKPQIITKISEPSPPLPHSKCPPDSIETRSSSLGKQWSLVSNHSDLAEPDLAKPSTLVRIFDRITADDFKRDGREATSWNSDRSWESWEKGEEIASVRGLEDSTLVVASEKEKIEESEKEEEIFMDTMEMPTREGTKEVLSGITLIKNGELVYVPELQEKGWGTEEMIGEKEQLFESLGSSELATQTRARMQCAQLKSDMEAFKAANPDSFLEDFVRWHSPRDWIEDSSTDRIIPGRLSDRMKISGVWHEVWESSGRIPATKQKPLFDCVKEGEKAIHYLECLTVDEVYLSLLPTIVLISFECLSTHHLTSKISNLSQITSELATKINLLDWTNLNISDSLRNLIPLFDRAETLLSNALAISKKIANLNLVERILMKPEDCEIRQNERESVDLFLSSNISQREYVFKYFDDIKLLDSTPRLRSYILDRDGEFRTLDSVLKL